MHVSRHPRLPHLLILLLLLLAAASISVVHAADPNVRAIEARKRAAIERLAAESSRPPVARFDEAGGRLTTLLGRFAALPGGPADRERAARDFLDRHADLMDLKPGLPDLVPGRRTDDDGGTVVTLRQQYRGLPVFDGAVLVGFDPAGAILHVRSRYAPDLDLPTRPGISASDAILRAEDALETSFDTVEGDPALVVARGGKGWPGWYLAWQVQGTAWNPPAEWVVFVDATSGSVIRSFNRVKEAGPACIPCDPATNSNCGKIFLVDPITYYDDPTLGDADNVDGAQVGCMLPYKTAYNLLDGTYANTQITSPRAGPPYGYLRSVNESAVDEMTAYFHATRAKQYLDSLGFTSVMNYSIEINAHDAGAADNAYYSPTEKALHFGTYGVDFAQDPMVVYHEYGHAIQDNQVTFFGVTLEGGALGEGFGDYWSGAMTDDSATTLLGDACLAPWVSASLRPYDGTPGSGCLRRLDRTKDYPRNIVFATHADGEIWSSALWSLRAQLGGAVTDRLIIKSHTFLLFDAGFIDNADALYSADAALYGGAHTDQITQALKDRGIPRSASPAPTTDMTGTASFACSTNHNYGALDYKECVFTQPGASRVRLHFSLFNTEAGADLVYISDGDYNQVQVLSGTPFGTGGGYSAAVWGGTIVARFRSDPIYTAAGFDIDSVQYSAGAGEVPDGASMPGTPLSVVPAAGGDVTLSWGASCASGDTDYEIYEGTIGDFGSHVPKTCSTGGAQSATITPSSGSSYYLIVPRNAIGEGSYGTASDGKPRPASASACAPQEAATVCQ